MLLKYESCHSHIKIDFEASSFECEEKTSVRVGDAALARII